MSSAARFLLEFEATGDQEVVSKIKAVGAAGKETATDLESLRGIEDPFEPIATGADAAVAPIEGVGTAAEGAVTPIEGLGTAAESTAPVLTDMGSATDELGGIFSGAGTATEDFSTNLDAIGGSAEAASGGLTDANTVVGDFGGAAETSATQSQGFGESVQGMSGSIVAIGGAIGGAVSAFFRYQDAQLRVQKSQLAVQRAQEALRKSMEGVQTLLATATSNTDGIAAANARWQAAQAEVNRLLSEGITTGKEYDAANKELQASQAALATEFAKGGGNAAKLTGELNKVEIQTGKLAVSQGQLDKNTRQANQTLLESAVQYATIAGSIVQMGSSMGKLGGPIGKMTMGLRGISGALTALTGVGLAGFTAAFAAGAAAAGAFLAVTRTLSFNLAGITDVLSGVGAAIGKTIPALTGFLTMIGDAGAATADFFTRYTESLLAWAGITGVKVDFSKQKFGTLVEQYIKTGTTGSAVFDKIIAQTVAWAKENGVSMDEVIAKAHAMDAKQKGTATVLDGTSQAAAKNSQAWNNMAAMFEHARQQTDLQGAALEKLIGPTTNLNAELNVMSGEVAKLTQADVESVTAIESQNRAMIVANAGFNNATVAAIQYQQALTEQTQTLVTNTDANNANAAAILALAHSEENAANAISAVNLEYANSVDKLFDLNAVLSDSEAAHKAVQTAVNETAAALLEEAIELEAASQSADSLVQQQLRLDNAFKAGVVSIKEWANGLAESEANMRGQSSALAAMGAKWSDIPPFVERNIETLKLFGVAAKQGGEAAREAASMASEAWRSATSEMGSAIQTLADAFKKGGEDMGDALEKGFETIEQGIGRSLTGAEQAALKGIAQMIASTEQAIGDWQLGQLMGETITKSGGQLASAFQSLASTAEGGMKQVFQRAAQIIRADSSLASAVNEVMAGVGKTAPDALLRELNAILPPGLKNSATTAAGQLPGSLDPAAAQAGQSAALTLSQEFAAAGTHIASVIKGIQAQIASIGTTAKPVVISITADVTKVGQQLNSVMTAAQSLKPIISVDADIRAAQTKIGALTGTNQKPVMIYVDADIRAAQTKISALTGTGQKPIMISVDADIRAAQTKIGALTGTSQKPIMIYVDANIRAAQTKIGALSNAKPVIIPVSYKVIGKPPTAAPINSFIFYRYKLVGKPPKVLPINTFIFYRYKIIGKIPNPPEIKRWISYKYRIVNRIPNPPEIKRFITYRYRVVGSRPNPPNLSRTITYRYRTVGSRPAQFGMHEMLGADTLIAAHKGERVDITPNATLPGETHTIFGTTPSRGRPITINVHGEINGRELIRFTKRGLLEEVSGAM